MPLSTKRLVAVGFLMLLGVLAGVDVAAACTESCVVVSAPFCRRCVDTGESTGATCQNVGTCGCFYTQNTCGGLASATGDDFQQDLGAAVTAAACTDGTAAEVAQPAAS
jgi:hypothetical protein